MFELPSHSLQNIYKVFVCLVGSLQIWLHKNKQSRVALEQLWFALTKHPKGLLWLGIAKGQISSTGKRGSGKNEKQKRLVVWGSAPFQLLKNGSKFVL